MGSLDKISTPFSNHVNSILNSAIWNDGEDGCISDTKILDTEHPKFVINDTLLDGFPEASGSAGIWRVEF